MAQGTPSTWTGWGRTARAPVLPRGRRRPSVGRAPCPGRRARTATVLMVVAPSSTWTKILLGRIASSPGRRRRGRRSHRPRTARQRSTPPVFSSTWVSSAGRWQGPPGSTPAAAAVAVTPLSATPSRGAAAPAHPWRPTVLVASGVSGPVESPSTGVPLYPSQVFTMTNSSLAITLITFNLLFLLTLAHKSRGHHHLFALRIIFFSQQEKKLKQM